MKLLQSYLVAFILVIASSCTQTESKGPAIIENTFDNLFGWTPDFTVSKDYQNSGMYSYHIKNGYEYTVGYSATVAQTIPENTRSITIEYDLYPLNANTDFLWVFEIIRPDNTSVLWKACESKDQIKESKKWTTVSTKFELPATVGKDFIVKSYGCSRNKGEYYLDNLKIFADEKQD